MADAQLLLGLILTGLAVGGVAWVGLDALERWLHRRAVAKRAVENERWALEAWEHYKREYGENFPYE